MEPGDFDLDYSSSSSDGSSPSFEEKRRAYLLFKESAEKNNESATVESFWKFIETVIPESSQTNIKSSTSPKKTSIPIPDELLPILQPEYCQETDNPEKRGRIEYVEPCMPSTSSASLKRNGQPSPLWYMSDDIAEEKRIRKSVAQFNLLTSGQFKKMRRGCFWKNVRERIIQAMESSKPSTSLKRNRQSSTSLEDNDPELGLDAPSAKRQHLASACVTSSNNSTSSVPSSVYPSPVDELVDDIDSRSSDCTAPPYSLPIPESPNSIDEGCPWETNSLSSFETVSNTPTTDSDTESPDKTLVATSLRPKTLKSSDDFLTYECMTPVEPSEPRQCPMPALKWANAFDVWHLMCKKDELAALERDARMLKEHPGLQSRMRAILLDWLIEVCEVYKLHRETYYLACDYLDRYLSSTKNVQKTHLQLIGITCLFIAAKVEEIYPPKIADFAYVTDGACREDDILQHEIVLLQALGWNISPVTAMGWLGIYMQLRISNRSPASLPGGSQYDSRKDSGSEEKDTFIYPQFSGMEFVQTAQLLDLCSLDVGIGNFSYAVIAAAAISHTFNKETAVQVSGYEWSAIQECARWMEPFFTVIAEESEHVFLMEQSEQVQSKCGLSHYCPNIVTDDSHIIQTHTISMGMFDRVCLLREQRNTLEKTRKPEASPATGLKCPEGLLTPPASSRKPLDDHEEDHEHDHRTQTTSSSSSHQEHHEKSHHTKLVKEPNPDTNKCFVVQNG